MRGASQTGGPVFRASLRCGVGHDGVQSTGMQQAIRFCTSHDGLRLAYATSGEGSPLVMPATWLMQLDHQWRSLAWRPWLETLSRNHRLLRYDSRGCGLSERDTA